MTPPTPLHLLDADVLIDLQHGHPAALAWFAAQAPALPSVPGLVVMELYQSAQNRRQEREVDVLLAPLPVVWPTKADCLFAYTEFRRLHLSHGLGLIDALHVQRQALPTGRQTCFGTTVCTLAAYRLA